MKQLTLNLDDATFASAENQAMKLGMPLASLAIAWLKSFSIGAAPDFEQLPRENKPSPDASPKTWIDAFSGDTDDQFLDREFPLEDRSSIPNREFHFEPDDT